MSTIKVDTITDEAGTGAPTFSQGAAVTGNLSATGTIAGGVFSGSGAGLTGVPSSAVTGLTPTFNPVAVTGTTPSLDVGSYNFFDQGTLTGATTVSFANVPTNARWSYSFTPVPTSGAWDVATATFLQVFSVTAEDTASYGIFFKPDGTKMYVIGYGGKNVNEYDLSRAWDISTATYLQVFSIGAQESQPLGIFFKPDGTKMYITGSNGDDVNEYDLSTAWDISTSTYLQNFSVAIQDTAPTDIFFKPDGTKMYILGVSGDDVNEYNLSTAWDISTASFLQLFSVATEDPGPYGIFFKPDGTKMYIVGTVGVDVNEYNLSTAWDISTASFLQLISVSAQDTIPTGVFFKPDGTKMYVIGDSGDGVYEYGLGTFSRITLPTSVVGNPLIPTSYNNRITYEFFTLDGGTTVTLIGEEIL